MKYTSKNLKEYAKEVYLECRECGHYPKYITDGFISDDEYKMYAKEEDMTVEQFKEFIGYLLEYCN